MFTLPQTLGGELQGNPSHRNRNGNLVPRDNVSFLWKNYEKIITNLLKTHRFSIQTGQEVHQKFVLLVVQETERRELFLKTWNAMSIIRRIHSSNRLLSKSVSVLYLKSLLFRHCIHGMSHWVKSCVCAYVTNLTTREKQRSEQKG